MEQWAFEISWRLVLQGIVVLVSLVAIGQWVAWILGIGRFRPQSDRSGWLIRDFASTISADFRHILASSLVVLFGIALFVGIAMDEAYPDAMQPVVNSFPGLLGAVLGFYFGEKQAREASAQGPVGLDTEPTEVTPPAPGTDTPRVDEEGEEKAKGDSSAP